MSEGKRTFFATIPGLVTGLAGLLTGIVGLVTVLIQLGVVGNKDSSDSSKGATTTTVVGGTAAPGATGGSGGGATATTEVPRFSVNPTTLDFASTGSRTRTVKVSNDSTSATLTVLVPRLAGNDAAQFSANPGDCTRPVAPGLSCQLQVTFSPTGPLRKYEATLEVTAQGARGLEVPVTGSSLLG